MSKRYPGIRGFTFIEVAVILGLVAVAMSMTTPQVQRALRQAKLRSAADEMYSLVLETRAQALRRKQQVVLFVDLSRRRVVTWVDRPPFNFKQDADEPTIDTYNIPSSVCFQGLSGGPNGASAVAFDTYSGNPGLVDMIVFRGDGTLVAPESPSSRPPAWPSIYTAAVPPGSVRCPGGCRGIYLSDCPGAAPSANPNTFRISVDAFGRSGRPSLLKWLPTSQGGNAGESDYVPPPWKWSS